MACLRTLVCAGCLLLGPVTTASAQMLGYPQGAFIWYSWPNGSAVGDCFGNCGAGCSDDSNPCGGRQQYWQLNIISEPQPTGYEWSNVECWWSDTLYLVRYSEHSAWGRWTYYGYVTIGCIIHDGNCPEFLWGLGCALWAGCGSGWDEQWSYDEFMGGSRRLDAEPIGSCREPPIL